MTDHHGRAWVGWVAAGVAAAALLVPVALAREAVGDWVALDGLLLWGLVAVAPRARPLAVGAFALLLLWEVARATGALLMDQDPLLYDLIYLFRHFVVLGRDLLGGAFEAVALGAGLALAAVLALGAWAIDRGRAVLPPRALAALALVGGLGWALGAPVRFSGADLVANAVESVAVRRDVARRIEAPAYEPFRALAAEGGPDLHVYVVESYGRILLSRKAARARWEVEVARHERTLREAGMASVSAYVTAPVSGGRSWLADATLLTGRPVAHESVFNEMMGAVDGMVHLPGALAGAGYDTVLVRPKDRARPGIELRNDLGFGRTVFFDDLAYTGPARGWGWIPDQYTLGWLRANALPADGPPRFLFAHLVSSHAPWLDLPERVDDWRSLQEGGAGGAEVEDREGLDELWMQLGRFQRRDGHRGKRKASADHLARYGQAVAYDLELLVEHVQALPGDRPAIVVLLGDHQPPLVAQEEDFDVPVHVIATDPALLEPFRARGFRTGWRLAAGAPPVLRMEGLMSLFLSAVSDDPAAVPVFPEGA